MLAVLLSLTFYVPLTMWFALLVAEQPDRGFLLRAVLFAWAVFVPLTSVVNDWIPFGVDDKTYFEFAQATVNSSQELLDLSRFAGHAAQPGFPFILSVLVFILGPNLLALKLFNLCLFILTALTWYKIALLLESRGFGRMVMVSVLCMSPLWFYVFFLLKDLCIVFLQSLFVLGVVQQRQVKTLGVWFLIAIVTLAVLPLRTALILQNMAILLSALVLGSISSAQRASRLGPLLLGGTLVVLLLTLAGSPAFLQSMGIYAEGRAVRSSEIVATVKRYQETVQTDWKFPVFYLLTEASGLNPTIWQKFDPALLRGVLAIPWIFFGVPCFLLGVLWLRKTEFTRRNHRGLAAAFKNSRLFASSWSVVLLFILSSFAVSWMVGDTTRWRLSDMPAMVTIASAGWVFATRDKRMRFLVGWTLVCASGFAGLHFLRELLMAG